MSRPGPVIAAYDVLVARAARLVASTSRRVNAGAGTSAPGVLIDRLSPGFVRRRGQRLSRRTVVVSGTNGKTTTAGMVASIFAANAERVLTNASGANLYQGVAAAMATARGDEGAAVFEVDEGALSRVAQAVQPDVLVLTNVLRDQLDRFGEPETVARLLGEAAHALPTGSAIVANADDPLLWHAVEDLDPIGFGVRLLGSSRTRSGRDADPEICPQCGSATRYRRRTLAHLGLVDCLDCGWASPTPAFVAEVADDGLLDRLHLSVDELSCELQVGGVHNAYNAVASVAAASVLGVAPTLSIEALASVEARFGRSEWLAFANRSFRILLAKNPASCVTGTQQIASDRRIRGVVVMVNDRTADSRDISWIWDGGLEALADLHVPIIAAGIRAADVALRFRYAGGSVDAVEPDVGRLLEAVAALTEPGDHVAVLATYTAMLEFRRAVLGSRRARVAEMGGQLDGTRR